jgi:hypothetical protein
MILWQSFGYFDSRTNDRVLADLAALIRPGGRLLLDLYHPGYFVGDQKAARPPRAEGVVITNEVREGRLASTIEYADGATETMNFELFAPEQIIERAARTGFTLVEQCCWWDEQRPPDPSVQRYQSMFERLSIRPADRDKRRQSSQQPGSPLTAQGGIDELSGGVLSEPREQVRK